MPKVYIAAAFRGASKRDPHNDERAYGELVDKDYIAFLESIEDVFLRHGFDTCLPHRDEGMWGKAYFDPAHISALCFRHVETSDVVFGLAEKGRGVHIELGYAARARKRLILAYRAGAEPSTLIWGFPRDIAPWRLGFGGETDTTIIEYESKTDLFGKLESLLKATPSAELGGSVLWARRMTGIIDIGSHTVKLRIFSHGRGATPRLLHESKESLGIIADVNASSSLGPSSLGSLFSVLEKYRTLCAQHDCKNISAVATAALRKASNAKEVLARIKELFSIEVKILTPEVELGYVFGAVGMSFQTEDQIAVLNLGGGSTQVGVGTRDSIDHSFLLPVGTRHITERWPWTDGFKQDAYEGMQSFVRRAVEEAIPEDAIQCRLMVHTGGELDFLLRCGVPLQLCNESSKHVSQIPVMMFKKFALQLMQMKASDVAIRFRLDPAWASGAIASNLIALSVAERLRIEAIVPSNLNVADGVLWLQGANPQTMLSKEPPPKPPRDTARLPVAEEP